MLWRMLTGLSIVGAIDLLVHLLFAMKALRHFESPPTFILDRAPSTLDAEPFAIPTSAGGRVRGSIFLPAETTAKGVILFCPEAYANSASAMSYAPALLEAGFAILSVDFGSQNVENAEKPSRPIHWITQEDVADVAAVLRFIDEQPVFDGLPVGLFGVSRGAAAALVAGARSRRVRSILAQGAFSTRSLQQHHCRRWLDRTFGRFSRLVPEWHAAATMWLTRTLSQWRWRCRYVHVENSLPQWRGREVLFVSGSRDSYIPSELTRRLCRQTGHDPAICHWVVDGAKHNRERSAMPREYDARVVAFFNGMCGSCELPDRVLQAR